MCGEHGLEMALALGARVGLVMILVPCAVKTASREAVNLVSRSRMRKLTVFAWSARSVEGLRACWVTRSADGVAVPPAIRTRRLSWWMNTRT